jgi:hypothetical protein
VKRNRRIADRFEQELEFEKRNTSVVPLLLIVVLILSIVGVAVYYLLQSRQVLTNQEANDVIIAALKAMGPVTIHFEAGMVKASVEEKPHDPNYKLLEKVGLMTVGKDKGWTIPVRLTPRGKDLLDSIAGVNKSKDKDGADLYVIPVAARKLVNNFQDHDDRNGPSDRRVHLEVGTKPVRRIARRFWASGEELSYPGSVNPDFKIRLQLLSRGAYQGDSGAAEGR